LQPFECGHGTSYFTVGADTTATTAYSRLSGTCEANGAIEATQVVKTLGAAVPETTFVAAVETAREPRDERLLAEVRVAADGSRQVTSHFDRANGLDCQEAGAPGPQDYYSTTLLPATQLALATLEVE